METSFNNKVREDPEGEEVSYNIIYDQGVYRTPQELPYGATGSMIMPNTCTGSNLSRAHVKPKPIIGDSNPRLMNGHADYSGIDLLVNTIRAIVLGSSIYFAWILWIK